jgi:hypothetical protein
VIGDRGKGWEIQVQPVAVQSKPKRMQDGDVGTKSLYIPPIRPLSEKQYCQVFKRADRPAKTHEPKGASSAS